MAVDIETTLSLAQAAKSASDRADQLKEPTRDAFQSTPDGVFWGRELGNLPGRMRSGPGFRGGDGLLFACANPAAVAAALNATLESQLASERSAAIAAADAEAAAATAALSAVLKK
jgi:hypothetical protein